MSSQFWDMIDLQIDALTTAISADEVIDILNRDGEKSAGDAFFAGSGGDDRVDEALRHAGWQYVWRNASYWWAMQAPDGSVITYIEGDVYGVPVVIAQKPTDMGRRPSLGGHEGGPVYAGFCCGGWTTAGNRLLSDNCN